MNFSSNNKSSKTFFFQFLGTSVFGTFGTFLSFGYFSFSFLVLQVLGTLSCARQC